MCFGSRFDTRMPSTGMVSPLSSVTERAPSASTSIRRDRCVHADLAAVVAEERLHRLRELDGPALADRPAPRLHRPGHHHRIVRAQAEDVAGPGELRHPEPDPRLDLGRLEQVARDVVRRRQELPDQAEAVRSHRLEGQQVAARRAGRGEHRRDHAVGEHLLIDVRQLAERRCVARREPGDPLDRRVQIARADQRASIREHVTELVLGPDVLRTVPFELQVSVHRSHVDDAVEVRMEVVTETRGGDLLRRAAAPDDVSGLQHQDALARLRQVARARQAVVAAADDDDVVAFSHPARPTGAGPPTTPRRGSARRPSGRTWRPRTRWRARYTRLARSAG